MTVAGFLALPTWQVALLGVAYFAVIYFGFALLTLAATRGLKAAGIGRVLDTRALRPQQVRREIGEALVSILIFGVGIIVPWLMLRLAWAQVIEGASLPRIALEFAFLLLWNDVHFYAHHRALHLPWAFPRFHIQHHRSHVTTPFSTYAFHPVEALLLGSVPLLPMLVYDFSWQALIALPVASLVFNNVGHANYDPFPARDGRSWLTAGRRHHLHHACFRGNYGFLWPFMDRLCGTALADDAADAILRRPLRANRDAA